jgi:hypothetical protein
MSDFLNTASHVGGFLFSLFIFLGICYAIVDAILDMYIAKKGGPIANEQQINQDNYYPYN